MKTALVVAVAMSDEVHLLLQVSTHEQNCGDAPLRTPAMCPTSTIRAFRGICLSLDGRSSDAGYGRGSASGRPAGGRIQPSNSLRP